MVVGEIPEAADLVVVGSGPGGYVAAAHAGQLGRKVLLIERNGETGLGGACLNEACIPTKAFVEVARQADVINRHAPAGLSGSVRFDMAAWRAGRDELVTNLRDGVRTLLTQARVTIVPGELRFTRPAQAVVEIGADAPRFYEFADVLIATGSRATPVPGLPIDGSSVVDTAGLLMMTELPAHLAVVGAGVSGVELGTALAKLGTRVVIVEACDRVLPALDARLARPVATSLRELGVEVRTRSVALDFDGSQLTVRDELGTQHVRADVVLVAAGRTPNTDQLGLDRLGVTPNDDGTLCVDPDRRMTEHVAAIGDVTPGPVSAHKASAEGIVAAEALSGRRVQFAPEALAVICFSDPELAEVGLTDEAARDEGMDPAVATVPLSASGRAGTLGTRGRGFMRVVADRLSGVVVGVQLAGPNATELINEAAVAIEMGATFADVAAIVHAHPTLGEMYQDAAHRLRSTVPQTRVPPGGLEPPTPGSEVRRAIP